MKGKIYMNKRIFCLTIAIMMLLCSLCACTSSSGDSLLEVVAGVAGTSSEEASSLPTTSNDAESSIPESSQEESSEPESSEEESEEEDDNLDVTYPEKNYSSPKKAYVNTQDDPLTMRSNPSSSNYVTILKIPKGAEISVKGETGSFYFVDYNGKLGWVSAAYVKFADSASSTPASSETSSVASNAA